MKSVRSGAHVGFVEGATEDVEGYGEEVVRTVEDHGTMRRNKYPLE